MDCLLLLKSLIIYLDSLGDKFGYHPVSNGAHSVSSFCFTLSQRELMKDKRVTPYELNHVFGYGHTRAACLGGVTQVCHFDIHERL